VDLIFAIEFYESMYLSRAAQEQHTVGWAVEQGLSVIRPQDRMPSLSNMRQRASETREDFLGRLCEAGESDDCFGLRETRASIQACGSLHDVDWLPTQDCEGEQA